MIARTGWVRGTQLGVCVVAWVLAACGGGGGGPTASPPTNPPPPNPPPAGGGPELDVGESAVFSLPLAPDASLTLPAAADRSYHVALIGRNPEPRDVFGSLRLVATASASAAANDIAKPVAHSSAPIGAGPTAQGWSAYGPEHLRVLRQQRERMAEWAKPATASTAEHRVTASQAPGAQIQFFKALDGGVQSTANLRAANAVLAFYEEVGVAEAGQQASDEQIQEILSFYERYGQGIINSIGGFAPNVSVELFADAMGVTRFVPAGDIDENGLLIVIQILDSPVGVGAFIADCDRFPSPGNAAPGVGSCPASNEGEYVYVGPVPIFPEFFPSAIVHEATHLASLGHALFGRGGFEPLWIEEGTAWLVQEKVSRLALGAPDGQALPSSTLFSPPQPGPMTAGIQATILNAASYLDATPRAGLFGDPADFGFTNFAGGAWLFMRHVMDLHSNGDELASLRTWITETTDVAGLESFTGKSLDELLDEFVAAVGAELWPEARAASPYHFRSYDFGEIVPPNVFVPGTWPYVEAESAFQNGEWIIEAFHGGPVYFRFNSGAGALTLNVTDANGDAVLASENVAITITRVR